jgi:hypothetical protein
MSKTMIEKVHGGYKVGGLELLAANCDCGGLSDPGGSGNDECCFTFSRVKREDNVVLYFGKKTTPNTNNNYEWGYRVTKDGVEVKVKMLDTRSPVDFKFGGQEPPSLSAWEERGWKVLFQFERPMIGTGEPWPEWCTTAEFE